MYWGHHYWGMHLFWWVFWAAIIVALFVWLWPRISTSTGDSAMSELRRRFAAGEIDEDEFRRRRDILEGKKPRDSGEPHHAGSGA